MKICPKCNKIMEDEAKFCSECAGELVPVLEQVTVPEAVEEIEEDRVVKEGGTETPTEDKKEEAVSEEKSAPVKKSSLKGKFVCMMLAVAAVALMYVFYGELGFAPPSAGKKTENIVFFEKDGQIYCTDLKGGEYAISHDYPVDIENGVYYQSAIKGELVWDSRLQASSDGKTVFFPDKSYDAEHGSYSLYCVKPGDDAGRYKVANRVVRYAIVEDGSAVYYLDQNGNLYRDDLGTETAIDTNVTDFLVFDDEERILYLVGSDLYTADKEGKVTKIASSIDEMRANETEKSVYYRKGTDLYRDDFKTRTLVANDAASLLANAGGYLVYQDTKYSVFLAKGTVVSTLDCPRSAEQFRFDDDFFALYYAEKVEPDGEEDAADDQLPLLDIYRISLKDGKAGRSERVGFDAVMYDPCALGAVYYQMSGDSLDLYLNGTVLGTDALAAVGHGDKIAFSADCDASGNGTLKIYGEKKTETAAQDVTEFGYTARGELVYLANVVKTSGKGQLYRYTKDGPELIAQDVSDFVIAS